MPGRNRSGRREPVRGDTSLSEVNHNHHNQSSLSSTRSPTAPVAAVPISQRFASTYFPPSPPSTIASSSLAESDEQEQNEEVKEFRGQMGRLRIDAERNEADDDDAALMSHSAGRRLTAAAAAVATTESNRPRHQITGERQHPQRGHNTHHNTVMPDTPQQTPNTMSPACASLSHHPTEAEHKFLRSILPDLPLQSGAEHVVGSTEDAGLDLVCKGWQGAVLDQSRIRSSDNDSNITNRALYAMMPPQAQAERLREEVLALLDVASERLRCDLVIIALRRNEMDDADWKAILHGLCYVGGTVVAMGGSKGPSGQDRLTNCTVAPGIVLVAVEV